MPTPSWRWGSSPSWSAGLSVSPAACHHGTDIVYPNEDAVYIDSRIIATLR